MDAELEYLQQLTELLQRKKAAETVVLENQAKLDKARTKDKKKRATADLHSSKEELEYIQNKETDLRRVLHDSWGINTMRREEHRSLPDIQQEDDEITEVTQTASMHASATPSSSLKLPKPEKYTRGQNFTRFCENFQDYVKLGKIKSDDLDLYFLSLVDDFTKDKLKSISLAPDQRGDAEQFIPIFVEKMTPRHEADNLKLKLCDLRQGKDETTEDFAYKLREISSRAYGTSRDVEATRLAACYSAFIKGLSSQEIRIKLRENTSVTGFEMAVEEACRLQEIRDSEPSRQPVTADSGSPDLPIEIMKIQDDGGNATNHPNQRHTYRRDRTGYSSANGHSNSTNRRGNRSSGNNNYSHHNSYSRDYSGSARNHDSRSRRDRDSGNSSQQTRFQNQHTRQRRSPIVCYNCQQPNHLARDCTLNW